jgi:hypothetical protein
VLLFKGKLLVPLWVLRKLRKEGTMAKKGFIDSFVDNPVGVIFGTMFAVAAIYALVKVMVIKPNGPINIK